MRTLTVFLIIALVTMVTAGRGWRIRNKRLRCKYDKSEWGECDTTTGTVTRVLTLRSGEEGCQQTENQSISCEKYERIQTWKAGKIERKRDRQEKKLLRKQAKNEMKEKKKLMKEHRKRCKYDYGNWSECDSASNTVSRVLTLRDGEEGCDPTHTVTITCDKFNRIQKWKAKKLERKSERKEQKLQWKQQKREMKEKRRRIKEQRLSLSCKYDKGEWSTCNNITNTVTRVLTLRDGEDGCEQTLDITISCARYERIQLWKAKKMEIKREKLTEKLQRKEDKNKLKDNKKMVKEQRKLGCSFDVSFSECNPNTQMVTKTYTPMSPDNSCETRSVNYSCEMHKRLMEKKMRRKAMKVDIKRMRKAMKQQRKGQRKYVIY